MHNTPCNPYNIMYQVRHLLSKSHNLEFPLEAPSHATNELKKRQNTHNLSLKKISLPGRAYNTKSSTLYNIVSLKVIIILGVHKNSNNLESFELIPPIFLINILHYGWVMPTKCTFHIIGYPYDIHVVSIPF